MTTPLKHFPKIREARELLLAQAEELILLKREIIKKAIEKGDLETANKAVDWLLSHMPGVDGVRVLESDIDNIKVIDGPKGPQISIGIALGGMSNKKELPPAITVDSLPVETIND